MAHNCRPIGSAYVDKVTRVCGADEAVRLPPSAADLGAHGMEAPGTPCGLLLLPVARASS